MVNRTRFVSIGAIVLLLSGWLIGCVKANFTEPITSFRGSINTSGAAIGAYYAELNQFEREIYLDERLYDPNKEVLATDEEGKPTPLVGRPFSAESIKARVDAIVLLGVYVERLGELAGSEAPKKFAEGMTALGDNLFNLEKTFKQLGKDNEERKKIDATAKNYSGPIGTVVGVIGRIYLEARRDAAVQEAVENGAPAVRQVLDLLQKDLTEAIDPLKKLGLKQELADRVTYYNEHRKEKQYDLEQRRQMLKEIEAAAARYEAAVTANPANLVQSMREAHEALLKYASSPKTPQNFAELLTALETFKNTAEEVAVAVTKIRDLRKGATS